MGRRVGKQLRGCRFDYDWFDRRLVFGGIDVERNHALAVLEPGIGDAPRRSFSIAPFCEQVGRLTVQRL